MTETTNSPPTPAASVDDMAASLQAKLEELKAERDDVRSRRDRYSARLKDLDAEIDKAERMTKALIPRHRNSTKKAEVD
jgi:chromosome segregation ATPase